MGTRGRPHDRRDRQQRHALSAIIPRSSRLSPWHHFDRLPRCIRPLHKLDLDPIQVATPGRYVTITS